MPRGYKRPHPRFSHHPGLDHPPGAPPPPPPAPPSNPGGRFIIVEYAHSWQGGELWIAAVTDITCHLYLRKTEEPTGMHNRSTTLRGLPVMTDPKYCMVQYEAIEQNEPGDTIYHTWNFNGWKDCEHRWWYFVGTEGGEPSPSASCIFHAHFEEQKEAESLKHTDLIDKNPAGVLDHADDSVTADKLAHDIDATGIGFDADKVDGKHAAELAGGPPLFYDSKDIYHEYQGLSTDGLYKGTGGAGSILLNYYSLQLHCGAPGAGSAYAGKFLRDYHEIASWSKRRRLKGWCRWTHNVGQSSYFLMGRNLANQHIGFWLDDGDLYATWRFVGGLHTSFLLAIAAATYYYLEVTHEEGVDTLWYVNDVEYSPATPDLPEGAPGSNFLWTAQITETAGFDKQIWVQHVKFHQDG